MRSMVRYFILFPCLGLFAATLGTAQIPDEFKNLMVFPKDISKDELIANMKNFSISLGVRCNFCHVGEEGAPLSSFDFPSDEKPTKNTARIMLRMKKEINDTFLKQIQHHEGGGIQVDCSTCHRGTGHPAKAEDILADLMKKMKK